MLTHTKTKNGRFIQCLRLSGKCMYNWLQCIKMPVLQMIQIFPQQQDYNDLHMGYIMQHSSQNVITCHADISVTPCLIRYSQWLHLWAPYFLVRIFMATTSSNVGKCKNQPSQRLCSPINERQWIRNAEVMCCASPSVTSRSLSGVHRSRYSHSCGNKHFAL